MAYHTLISTDDYLEGALVLKASLDLVRSRYPLVVNVSSGVSVVVRERLTFAGCRVHEVIGEYGVGVVAAEQITTLRWRCTFDKLSIFSAIAYDRIVFLDADMLITSNIDKLFEIDVLSFANGVGAVKGYEDWVLPNTGLFVVDPKPGLGEAILATWARVARKKSNFSDQDLVHGYFKDYFANSQAWCLPVQYNAIVSILDKIITENGLDLNLKQPSVKTVKVLHFAMQNRPWLMSLSEILYFYGRVLYRRKHYERKSMSLYLKTLYSVRLKYFR